jgi:ferrochelatase
VRNLEKTAVLMMGYGSPSSLDELEKYLSGIVRSKKPSKDMLEDFKNRYRSIGGRSPMNEIMERQRTSLEKRLRDSGLEAEVFIGTKHWQPSIRQALDQIEQKEFKKVVALPLSPYDSVWIMSSYQRGVDEALGGSEPRFELVWVKGWNRNPFFIEYWAQSVRQAMGNRKLPILFSAHSLPTKMLEYNDRYPEILRETSSLIAEKAEPTYWEFTYQSAGDESDAWLKPDIKTKLAEFKNRGFDDVVVASIGFVFDHLEVLYDLDVLAKNYADRIGIRMHRAVQPNDHPLFIEALTQEVLKAAAAL